MGVRQKPPTALQNTRGGRGRGVAVGGRPASWRTPPLPNEITNPLRDPIQALFQPRAVKHARTIWGKWWRSEPSIAVNEESDFAALQWWIICVFRRALYIWIVREQPLVKGSTGQPVANPLEDTIGKLTRDIQRAESRFGMTTLDRFRLNFERTVAETDDDMSLIAEYRKLLG